MNNFVLDDIEDLVISARRRIDTTGEYDISYYENYINENIRLIEELIKNVQNNVDLIEDNNIKRRVLNWSKDLVKAYEKNKNKHPRVEYENSSYSKSHGTGYLQTHKYSLFIEKDFEKLVGSYSNIINFMNNIYQYATISMNKGEKDSSALYDIFSITKKTCSSLGIHCPDSLSLYDSITGDPYAEKSELLEMDFEIVEDNSLSHDIIITSLPYTVTSPAFTWEGPSTYEKSINKPKPKIWYNKSYFEKTARK